MYQIIDTKANFQTMPQRHVNQNPRDFAWYTLDDDCTCSYKHSGIESKANVAPKWLKEISWLVCSVLAELFPQLKYLNKNLPNGVNINRYANGNSGCGWHSDDEQLFYDSNNSECQQTTIISLSLGASRSFQCRKKYEQRNRYCNYSNQCYQIETILDNGDICVMDGYFQNFYHHRVPIQSTVVQPRINLTFRSIVTHCHETCKKML